MTKPPTIEIEPVPLLTSITFTSNQERKLELLRGSTRSLQNHFRFQIG